MPFVYVVSATNGYVKIGSAQLPYERFSTLQNGSPLALTFEYLCACDNAAVIEKAIHVALAPWHRHREWYEIDTATAVRLLREQILMHWQIREAPHRNKGRGAPPQCRPTINEIAEVIC